MNLSTIAALLLALTTGAAASRDCRKTDATFVSCWPVDRPQRSSDLVEIISGKKMNALVKNTVTGRNYCSGANGSTYLYDLQEMDQKAGPVDFKCGPGTLKLETKIIIWRWRNSEKYCDAIDDRLREALRNEPLHALWYTTPHGPQVLCK